MMSYHMVWLYEKYIGPTTIIGIWNMMFFVIIKKTHKSHYSRPYNMISRSSYLHVSELTISQSSLFFGGPSTLLATNNNSAFFVLPGGSLHLMMRIEPTPFDLDYIVVTINSVMGSYICYRVAKVMNRCLTVIA